MPNLTERSDFFSYVGLILFVVGGVLIFYLSPKKAGKKKLGLTQNERKTCPIIDKKKLSHDTVRLRVGLPDETMRLGLPIGQHLRIFGPNRKGVEAGKWNGNDDPEKSAAEIGRKYTPTTGQHVEGYFDLVVKVYGKGQKEQFPDGGKLSPYLGGLQVGDKMQFDGPWGKIEYIGLGKFAHQKKQLKATKIGMMGGGSGITPLLQIMTEILLNPKDTTEISLIYANQEEEDILCRDMLEDLKQKFPDRVKLWYTVDRPPAIGWKYSSGFITKEMICEHLYPPNKTTVFCICGPRPMVQYACKDNLIALGHAEENLLIF
eukprot:Platyproteum_vivax@DN3745_c0_g1_i1.p1